MELRELNGASQHNQSPSPLSSLTIPGNKKKKETELDVEWSYGLGNRDKLTLTITEEGAVIAKETKVITDTEQTKHTFTGLVPGEYYRVKGVVGINDLSSAPKSKVASTCPSPLSSLTIPRNKKKNETELDVEWSYGLGNRDKLTLTITEEGAVNAKETKVITDTKQTKHTFTGLVPGGYYRVKGIVGINDLSSEPKSKVASTCPSPLSSLTIPRNKKRNETELDVEWSYGLGNRDKLTLTITEEEAENSKETKVITDTEQTKHTFTGLDPGVYYIVKGVVGINDSSSEPKSEVASTFTEVEERGRQLNSLLEDADEDINFLLEQGNKLPQNQDLAAKDERCNRLIDKCVEANNLKATRALFMFFDGNSLTKADNVFHFGYRCIEVENIEALKIWIEWFAKRGDSTEIELMFKKAADLNYREGFQALIDKMDAIIKEEKTRLIFLLRLFFYVRSNKTLLEVLKAKCCLKDLFESGKITKVDHDISKAQYLQYREMYFKIKAEPSWIHLEFEREDSNEEKLKRSPFDQCLNWFEELKEESFPKFMQTTYDELKGKVEDFMCDLLEKTDNFKDLCLILEITDHEKNQTFVRNDRFLKRLTKASKLQLINFLLHKKTQAAVDYLRDIDCPYSVDGIKRSCKSLTAWCFAVAFYPFTYMIFSLKQKTRVSNENHTVETAWFKMWATFSSEAWFLIMMCVNVIAQKLSVEWLKNATRVVLVLETFGQNVIDLIKLTPYKNNDTSICFRLQRIVVFIFLLVLFILWVVQWSIDVDDPESWSIVVGLFEAVFFMVCFYAAVSRTLLLILPFSLVKSLLGVRRLVVPAAIAALYLQWCYSAVLTKIYWDEPCEKGLNATCSRSYPYKNSTSPLSALSSLFYLFPAKESLAEAGLSGCDVGCARDVAGWLVHCIYSFFVLLLALALFNKMATDGTDMEAAAALRRWRFRKCRLHIEYLKHLSAGLPSLSVYLFSRLLNIRTSSSCNKRFSDERSRSSDAGGSYVLPIDLDPTPSERDDNYVRDEVKVFHDLLDGVKRL